MNNTILNILIGGAAGQGLQTVGPILAKGLVRKGFSVHVKQEYESRVRGGHNVFALRTGAKKVSAPCDRVDILVCLNKETFHIHQDELADNALVIFDQDWGIEYQRKIIIPLDLPGEKITRNSAAAAVLAGLIGIDKNTLTGVYKDSMGEKKAYKNMVTIDAAFAWLYENRIDFSPLPQIENPQSNLLLTGHEALAIGAVSAGIKFCSYYPMSPATSITQTLVNYAERMGLVIEQVEDEIAAINMALGASFAGAPSLVATSGGGFALMAEGVSLAGISETPIVIVIGQRPGPGTGLPTRTEQADLLFALYSSHGEFPRVIYAPADVEQCFHLARKAVFTAERYQLPAFVLTDQYVAESFQDMKPVDMEKLDSITKPGAGASSVMLPYARYRITESGISPRLIPGLSENLVIGDSHEHTETGHMTEDLALRKRMVEKRLRKAVSLKEVRVAPEYAGDPEPDILFVCWGSTRGAVMEASEIIRSGGRKISWLHFSQVWPLYPDNFLKYLEAAKMVISVEGNATGQFARLIRMETGFHIHKQVLRYDGLPITPDFIINRAKI